jgi:hypothetical protein
MWPCLSCKVWVLSSLLYTLKACTGLAACLLWLMGRDFGHVDWASVASGAMIDALWLGWFSLAYCRLLQGRVLWWEAGVASRSGCGWRQLAPCVFSVHL